MSGDVITRPYMHDDTPYWKWYHWTDLGNSERFADKYSNDTRYCHKWSKWLAWDGCRWDVDDIGSIRRYAKDIVHELYTEALSLDDEDKRKLIAFALRCESDQRIRGMISLAESDIRLIIKPEMLDSRPFKLNLLNGTLDLELMKFSSHDRADLNTKICNTKYEETATCPTWEKCLDKWMNGNQDDIKFIQKALGYSLTGDTGEHCFFILYGTGRNGKSTFLDVVRHVLKDYAMNTAVDTILQKRSGGISNDIARLHGARFVTASESEEGQKLAESLIKQMTGGDALSARFLYGEIFDFKPQFKLWVATNHEPEIKGTDPAIWSRIRKIPFTVTIPEDERDKQLSSKLRDEAPGILRWMIHGYELWKVEGLKPSENVKNATKAYQERMDAIASFIKERCELAAAYTKSSDLYEAFKCWNDGDMMSQKEFSRRMKEKGFTITKRSDGNYWYGLKFMEDGR